MEWEQGVLDLAREVHGVNWKIGSDVSFQTKSAQRINREWQNRVLESFGDDRFIKEYPVAKIGTGKEAIDLVDKKLATAFELKVSANNTHFEFYRDIFKIAVHNMDLQLPKICTLIFITPESGAKRLRKDFADQVRKIAQAQLRFDVESVGI